MTFSIGLSAPGAASKRPAPPTRPYHGVLPHGALAAAGGALGRAKAALLARQNPAGFWVGELQGDSILESEYILLRFILGQEHRPELPKMANYLRQIQNAEGGWSLFPGGPSDLSGTVKAYYALKLLGDSANSPHLTKARQVIHRLGGAEKCNSFSKFYLTALGQMPWEACPSIPPEIVYLPKWLYFNLYHVSAWTRTMILPLAIVTTLKPTRKMPPELSVAELYVGKPEDAILGRDLAGFPTNWRKMFLYVDRILKVYDESPLQQLRKRAIDDSMKWLLEHMEGCDGLGAIFPPMVYMLIVFKALGYPADHPIVAKADKDLCDFFIEEGDTIRVQPCFSPVWDTGIALHALAEARIDINSEPARRATNWLLEKECRVACDWQKNCPDGAPAAGWFFEFNNPQYPDVDDTAMVAMALKRAGGEPAAEAVERGKTWLLAMQNDDGGWAAFDRTKSRPLLEHVPFADHNAMQDPSCPDIAGRALESLGHCGMTVKDLPVRRAIAFLMDQQDESGAWWGRWGVNYIYGTWQVLCGLKSVGEDMTRPYVRRAAEWLLSVQKEDGSFGESCQSYEDASLKGQGESTPSQTAWGAMALMAALDPAHPSIENAILWLARNQDKDGTWPELYFTGTGFPKVFYLKYHLYRLYFPLMALGRYANSFQTAPVAVPRRTIVESPLFNGTL
jgi:squalene-hopene/tetraprenyl-beta-curcumene cyclase